MSLHGLNQVNVPQGTHITPPTGDEIRQNKPQGPPPLPLRTPAQVLAEAKQRFPQVDERILKKEDSVGIKPLTNQQQDMLQRLARNPGRGLAPVVIGTGENSKVALMPTKGVPGPNPGLTIQQYVKEGQEMYDRIMSGQMDNVPHGKEEVAKVMWFLQALGSAKASESSGQHPPAPVLFKEGAFSIEDPDHKLEQFLFTANSYERKSSHLTEFQNNCRPRGTDIRGVPMPNGRKTVLFARMPGSTEVANSQDPNMGKKGMLFLKMEPNGCRGLFSTGGTGRGELTRPSAGKSVKRFFSNLKDFVAHGKGLVQSLGQRFGLMTIRGQNNRERIPSDVRDLYTNIMREAKEIGELDIRGLSQKQRTQVRSLAFLLERGNPLASTSGLRVMIRNLEEVSKQLDALLPTGANNPQALTAFGGMIKDSLARLKNHGDYPDMRIGNEVILMKEDMKMGDAVPVQGSGRPVTQEGSVDRQTQEILLAGHRYALNNIGNVTDQEVDHNFSIDMNRGTLHIGGPGVEGRHITHNPEAAKAAVLELAGGDGRIAKALMSLANQGLSGPLIGAMQNHGAKSTQTFIGPGGLGGLGDFHISRMPDEGKTKVFRVGVSFDEPMGTHGSTVDLSGNRVRLSPESRVQGELWLEVRFQDNGFIEPKFHGDPTFSYNFAPAPQQ